MPRNLSRQAGTSRVAPIAVGRLPEHALGFRGGRSLFLAVLQWIRLPEPGHQFREGACFRDSSAISTGVAVLLNAVTTPVRALVQTGEPPNLARKGDPIGLTAEAGGFARPNHGLTRSSSFCRGMGELGKFASWNLCFRLSRVCLGGDSPESRLQEALPMRTTDPLPRQPARTALDLSPLDDRVGPLARDRPRPPGRSSRPPDRSRSLPSWI